MYIIFSIAKNYYKNKC